MKEPMSIGLAIDISTADHVISNKPTRGLSVAVAGNVVWKDKNGNSITSYLSAGVIHEIATNTIVKTGTTATTIVAYF